MVSLILPDSNFYIDCARAGQDPFRVLAARAEEWEFATCGMVALEVCRVRSHQGLYEKFRERFSVMIYIQAMRQVWQRATHLAWALDRQGVVLPASDVLIAACALQTGAAVLTRDAHFRQIPGLDVRDQLG